MHIYLLRHVATQAKTGLCYGHSDIPLAENYPQQHSQIKKNLPPVKHIYTSPLSRCRQLAEDLVTHQTLIIEECLRELNFGAWEQRYFNDINPQQLKYWTENYLTQAPPAGESFQQLIQRCQQFWQQLQTTDEDCLIITHAGVIRALLMAMLTLSYEQVFHFKVDYGAMHGFKKHAEWVELLYWNQPLWTASP